MEIEETDTNTASRNASSSPRREKTHEKSSRVDRVPTSSEDGADDSFPNGRTTIADDVVAKVAGLAAREVEGVHALGGGGARAIGVIRDAVNATDLTQGVKVEVGETQAAADITIVVEYPAPIQEVAESVRLAVSGAISKLAGLEVIEVNVDVDDVHLPTDETGDDTDTRVS